jgi:hypothetical protein
VVAPALQHGAGNSTADGAKPDLPRWGCFCGAPIFGRLGLGVTPSGVPRPFGARVAGPAAGRGGGAQAAPT